MNSEPSNREIEIMLKSLHDVSTATLEQVKKTNGRVTKLELWQANLQGASSTLKTGWGILGVFVIGMVYAMFNMWVQFQSLDQKIEKSVAQSFETYLELNGYVDIK